MTTEENDLHRHYDRLAQEFARDGIVVLRQHFDKAQLRAWADAFKPLLDAHLQRESDPNRGAHRHYVTLPFSGVFADPAIFADPTILALVERIVGLDPVMCQLATDTPMAGSDYQPVHRDVGPLFPEAHFETPSFQLAVNFPLCDVTLDNGPFET